MIDLILRLSTSSTESTERSDEHLIISFIAEVHKLKVKQNLFLLSPIG